MNNQIEIIKENDLFNFKLGDRLTVDDDIVEVNFKNSVDSAHITPRILIHQGYAKYVTPEPDIDKIVEDALKSKIGMFEFDSAENHMDCICLKTQAYYRLLLIADALNGDWEPDWSNTNENKYYIHYDNDPRCKDYECNMTCYYNTGTVIFESAELVKLVINHSRAKSEILDVIFKK